MLQKLEKHLKLFAIVLGVLIGILLAERLIHPGVAATEEYRFASEFLGTLVLPTAAGLALFLSRSRPRKDAIGNIA
jgi:hypothetical protein